MITSKNVQRVAIGKKHTHTLEQPNKKKTSWIKLSKYLLTF